MPKTTDQIVFGFGRIAALLRAGQWQAGSGADLNPAQAEILTRIARRPMRPGELAAHMAVSPASLSDSVSSLVGKGLAERQPDAEDGRARLVVATEDGKTLAATLPAAPAGFQAALDALPEPDRARLLRTLIHLIRELQLARAIPVQRMCGTCRHFRPHTHDDAARPHHCAFVNAAFGDADLRLDCDDHDEVPEEEAAAIWRRLTAA
ncbi:MAG: winged helix-turn-helix transcriptional regulator [Rhodobacteraceae bacterium]|nr:winged helix-turn-helix transcriptional regulator [Paracoccaceae bacterium]